MIGIFQPLAARMLIGEPNPDVSGNLEYQKVLPELNQLYRKTWRWHGTGRFHHHESEKIDVMKEIIEKNGLTPHKDILDYSRGTVYTISTSAARTYSSLYAQFHYEKGKKLRNTFQTKAGWFYYITSIALAAARNDPRLFSKEFRDRNNLNDKGTASFHQKLTKEDLTLKDYLSGGVSDISGNYPLLIGIKEKAFSEASMTKVYGTHESRSETPIEISSFTHIEVPLENVAETKTLLEQKRIDLPVIPIEWAEEFSKTLPVSFLKDGVPLK